MAQKIRGITIDLGVDTSKLTKGLKDANSSLRSTQTELKDVNKLLKLDPKNTTLLKQKTELLNDAIGKTKDKLSEQKKLMEELKKAGDTTDNRKQQQALERDIEATKNQLKDLEKQAKDTPSAFSASMEKFGGQMQTVGGKMEAFGSKMMGITAAITGVAAASVAAFNEVDEASDTIIAKTGATGSELAGMEDIVNNIAGKMPADFSEIGDAVGDVATRFKLSGDELEEVSTAFLQFSKLNGTSVSTSIATVQKAMAAFGVSTDDTVQFLDYLNYVGQQTGVSMDALATTMVSNAASFQEMGLNAEQSAMFLGQLEVSGVDAGAVLAGLKKALANATKEGKALPDALAEIQDEMSNANNSTEGLQTAFELFGNKAGSAIYNACKNGQLDFKNLAKQAEKSMTTVNDTFEATLDAPDKAQVAFNKLKIAGSKLGAMLLDKLTPAIEKVGKWIEKITKKWDKLDDAQKNNIIRIAAIVAAIGPLVAGIGKVISIAGTLMAHPIMAAIGGIAAIIGGITLAIKANNDAIEAAKWENSELAQSVTALSEEVAAADAARKEEIGGIQAEYGEINNLKNKYNELVGEKGEIATKDQEQADYILTTLANALGIEKDEVLKLRDANGKLGDSIERVIQLKMAESLLETGKDEYNTALEQQNEAKKKIAETSSQLEQTQANYNAALAEENRLRQEYNDYVAKHGENSEMALELADASRKTEELRQQMEGQKQTLQEALDTMQKTQVTIDNYRGLQKATMTGNIQDMEYWSARMVGGLKDATNATASELEAQTQELVDGYIAEKKAVKDGLIEVSDEQFKQEEEMIRISAQEAAKAKGVGESYVDGIMNGLRLREQNLYSESRRIGARMNEEFQNELAIHSPSKKAKWIGEMYGKGLEKGLQASINPVATMANRLASVTSVPLASGSTTSNTVNNSPTIVVNAAAGQSASSIADAVITRLNNTYRQATKTFA